MKKLNKKIHLSVVIPTYNRPEEIFSLLINLSSQTRLPDEVIIVDSTPDNSTKEKVYPLINKVEYEIKYIKSEKGLTKQRNIGIENAKGDVVCFLDDDVLLDPKFLEVIESIFYLDEKRKIGGVSGFIVNGRREKPSIKWKLRRLLFPGLNLRPGFYHHLTGYSVPYSFSKEFNGIKKVDYLMGVAAYRKEILKKFPFDVFFEGYGQGEDLYYSLKINGEYELLWSGDARLLHLHAPSGRPNPKERGKMIVRNRYYIYKTFKKPHSSEFWFWWGVFWDMIFTMLSMGKRGNRKYKWYLFQGMLEQTFNIFSKKI